MSDVNCGRKQQKNYSKIATITGTKIQNIKITNVYRY